MTTHPNGPNVHPDFEQMSFDPLDFEDRMNLTPEQARREAQAVRRMVAKTRKQDGWEVKSWTLTGQLRKYRAFGVPDGRVRPVYYLNCSKGR